jgi:hypothetical protein
MSWRLRVGRCLAVALVLTAGTAEAQEWFPRFDFQLDGQYATSGDPRFNWMFEFGADLDVLRGDRARAVFIARYEAIAGEQFRRFDVNQANYLLEGALLFRAAGIELGPVWHHVSRHLSDRPKRFPIDWNMIALRARDDGRLGPLDAAWRADARATVTSAFVDYDWEVEAEGELGYALTPRLALTAGAVWRIVGVDDTMGRGAPFEGRVEAGVRMQGRAAAAELFAGVERRLDPYPLEFSTASWFLAGLRLSSR